MRRVWVLWAFGVVPVAGQPAPLGLRDAVARALSSHPALTGGQERIRSAESLRLQAALPPNPRLNLQSENSRTWGRPGFSYWRESDTFAFLQQTVETAGKREKRTGLAVARLRRAELERQLLERQIGARVQVAYWGAAGSARLAALLLETVQNFEQVVEYHEVRVREGAMAEADLIRVRLERDRLALAANAQSLDATRARIRLFQEMGQSDFPEVSLPEPLELDHLPESLARDPDSALQERVEVQLAKALVEEARSAVSLQQAAATPNLDALFGLKRTSGFSTIIAGLQLDIPLFNRNQGGIAASLAEVRVAESALAATSALVRAEVATARREVETRRRQLAEYLRGLREQAVASTAIARAAYREGGTDLLRLLDAERLRLDVESVYIRSLAEYRQSIATLDTAMGVRP